MKHSKRHYNKCPDFNFEHNDNKTLYTEGYIYISKVIFQLIIFEHRE